MGYVRKPPRRCEWERPSFSRGSSLRRPEDLRLASTIALAKAEDFELLTRKFDSLRQRQLDGEARFTDLSAQLTKGLEQLGSLTSTLESWILSGRAETQILSSKVEDLQHQPTQQHDLLLHQQVGQLGAQLQWLHQQTFYCLDGLQHQRHQLSQLPYEALQQLPSMLHQMQQLSITVQQQQRSGQEQQRQQQRQQEQQQEQGQGQERQQVCQ